jgi:5-methylcytosine-specific restriction endonuclease McrA
MKKVITAVDDLIGNTGSTFNALRDRNHKFYLLKKWRSARLIILNDRPLCEVCHTEPAFHVHHIEPLHTASGWRNRLNLDNLISICISCHSKETAKEQAALRAVRIDARMEDLNNFE